MKNEIYQAFDQFVDIDGDDAINDWLAHNQDKLPLHKLEALKNGESLAIELKREPLKANNDGRTPAPSMPKPIESSLFKNTKYKLAQDKNNPLQAGEKTTQLIITNEIDPRFPQNKNFKIQAVEFQVPGENVRLPKGFVYEQKLTGEEFQKAVQDLDLN